MKTARFILAPLQELDVAEFLALQQDPCYQTFLGASADPERARRDLDERIEAFASLGYGLYSIRTKGGDFLGVCGLQNSQVGDGSDVEALCAILPSARRRGVATEALHAVLHDGLFRCRFPRILGVVREDNTKSLALIRHLGFQFVRVRETETGPHPEHIYEVTRDSMVMASEAEPQIRLQASDPDSGIGLQT